MVKDFFKLQAMINVPRLITSIKPKSKLNTIAYRLVIMFKPKHTTIYNHKQLHNGPSNANMKAYGSIDNPA